jgi:hypothetical protein
MKRKHSVVIEIECLDAQSGKQARERLVRWIEFYGHTTSSHGFDFTSVAGRRYDDEITKVKTFDDAGCNQPPRP